MDCNRLILNHRHFSLCNLLLTVIPLNFNSNVIHSSTCACYGNEEIKWHWNTATELVRAQKKLSATDNAYISGSQIYGLVNSDLHGTAYDTGSDVNTQTDVNDKSETAVGDLATQANLWKYKTGLYKR